MHACRGASMASMNRVQKVGAQAITGAFHTVATAIGKAEANIRTVQERHSERATKLWVNLHTLPKTNPLSKLNTRVLQRLTSPLQKIARTHQNVPTDRMEVIQPYVITPWEHRVQGTIVSDRTQATEAASSTQGIVIATSSSERSGMVGMGGAIRDTLNHRLNGKPTTYSITLGERTEQNPYTAELASIALA